MAPSSNFFVMKSLSFHLLILQIIYLVLAQTLQWPDRLGNSEAILID